MVGRALDVRCLGETGAVGGEPDRLRCRPIDDRSARAGVENGGDFDAIEANRQPRRAHIVEDERNRGRKSLEHPGFKFRRHLPTATRHIQLDREVGDDIRAQYPVDAEMVGRPGGKQHQFGSVEHMSSDCNLLDYCRFDIASSCGPIERSVRKLGDEAGHLCPQLRHDRRAACGRVDDEALGFRAINTHLYDRMPGG